MRRRATSIDKDQILKLFGWECPVGQNGTRRTEGWFDSGLIEVAAANTSTLTRDEHNELTIELSNKSWPAKNG